MGRILDNPRAFLESLSSDEFKQMLDNFDFEYEDISNCSEEIKALKKYIYNYELKMSKISKRLEKEFQNLENKVSINIELGKNVQQCGYINCKSGILELTKKSNYNMHEKCIKMEQTKDKYKSKDITKMDTEAA